MDSRENYYKKPIMTTPTDPDKMVYASRWYDIPQLQGVTTAQPAQEPWRESASDYERGFVDGMQKQAQSSVDKAVNRMAQRPWVGLTDEEKNEITWGKTVYEILELAEAKLKEKNA